MQPGSGLRSKAGRSSPVIGRAGIDNVMWAIDYPFESSVDAAVFIDRADLTPSQRTSICHANAERIFRISPA
jgi:predicted TIM-barrel fold metal-dependent hydrolase